MPSLSSRSPPLKTRGNTPLDARDRASPPGSALATDLNVLTHAGETELATLVAVRRRRS